MQNKSDQNPSCENAWIWRSGCIETTTNLGENNLTVRNGSSAFRSHKCSIHSRQCAQVLSNHINQFVSYLREPSVLLSSSYLLPRSCCDILELKPNGILIFVITQEACPLGETRVMGIRSRYFIQSRPGSW